MYRTEIEIIQSHQQNLYLIDKHLKHKQFSLNEIGEFVSGLLHLNKGIDLQTIYINSYYESWSEMTITEIEKEGNKFLIDRLHPDFLKYKIPEFLKLYQEGDANKVFSAFQQARKNVKVPYENFLTVSKILQKEEALFNISIPINDMNYIVKKIERIIEEEVFFRKHFNIFMSLSKREKEILQMVAHGLTNNEIGDQLFISKHTVRTHRNQINQKLNIRHFRDVIKYAQAFDLL